MNPLHLSTLGKTDSFCGILAFRPTPHSSARFRKNFTSRKTSRSSFLVELPVWSSRAGSNRGGKLLISACSRRPSQRRSFLREKLIEEGKVRNYPTFHIPDSNLNDQNSVPFENTKPEFFPEQTSDDIENVRAEKIDVLGESAMRGRLEDWVHQYKKDNEYWGVGSGPIFTIFEDLDRNVRRVSVDEAEIFGRHEVGGEFPDLNTKIAQAKHIAVEAETGKYEFPRSSSIAKFVAEGTRPLTVDPLPSVPVWNVLLPKVRRIGFAMLCGCFVVWALKQLFASRNDGQKLTRFQKEMLRRKMKSRLEKGTIVDGNVEVLANDSALESEAEPLERPRLDKQKLMTSIFESKASSGNATGQESGDVTAKDSDFNNKILEIQGMARQARELEQKDPSPLIDNDNENSKAIDVESDVLDSNDDKKADMLLEKSNMDAGSENQSNLNGNIRGDLLLKMADAKMDGEWGTDFPRNLLDRTSTDDCKRDGTRSFNETSANAKDGDSSSKNGCLGIKAVKNVIEVLPDPNGRETNAINESGTAEETPSYDSFNQKVSPSSKMKPRIILSVEEAREYHSRTPDTLTDKEQTDVQAQVRGHFISPNAPSTLEEEQPKQKVTEAIREETHSNDEEPMAMQDRELEQQNPSLLIDNDNENSKAINAESDVLDSDVDKKAHMLLKKSNMDAGSENQSNLNGNIRGDLLVKMADAKMDGERGTDFPRNLLDHICTDDCKRDGTRSYNETSANAKEGDSSSKNRRLGIKAVKNGIEVLPDPSERETDAINESGTAEETPSYDSSNQKVSPSSKMKPRIILSVEEAREYLSQTHHTLTDKEQTDVQAQVGGHFISPNAPSTLEVEQPKQKVTEPISEETHSNDEEPNGKAGPGNRESSEPYEGWNSAPLHTNMEKRHVTDNLSSSRSSSHNSSAGDNLADAKSQKAEQNWMEKNIQEFGPLIKKVGEGFRENYIGAKEKAQVLMESGNVTPLGSLTHGEDLAWMEDDSLREIVFKVRENELAGRDPFHLMDAEDKQVFFKGLEKKVAKANDKLAVLHEFIHSKVENVDYGADVISVYDPPEKIIPRWKGPLPSEDPEFLNNFIGQKNSPFSENIGLSHQKNGDAMDGLQESEQPSETPPTTYGITNLRKLSGKGASTNPRTVIEGSDGSIKAGKKSGKEQWEHTKKWTREFLEVYKSETDPEIKSILKDMGKDLDRWTTDKDVQEAAELMDRIPKRRRKYIEKKVNKLKREVEMFGSQAVVSKYKEYLDEKEPDYLWWLDLPFVLSIELYTSEDNVPRVGFYSLEMAEDLELNPKQYHVIAFEDRQDCKNLCHIIQDHMDLHGNGNAFVVARPPKDTYREAKANGFNITVIRKGELQLNVDQTLEEVEDEIIEIGSKMYHDKIMRERGVSIDGLMKGVFRADRTSGRTPRKRIGKPAKTGIGRPTARGFGRPTNH
ncbi:hypothetical protein ACLOJK_009886 [Asimina triloba]